MAWQAEISSLPCGLADYAGGGKSVLLRTWQGWEGEHACWVMPMLV